MKKFFTLIAAVALAASVNAQVLTFTQKYAKGSVPETFSAAGVESVVFDRNGYLYHGRVKQLADGARNGGLKF